MKIFKTELYKLITGRIFLLIVAVAVTLNAYLMFRTASSSESTPEEYKAIYSELEKLSDTEKLDWLEARLNEFSGQHHYDWGVLYELKEECDGVVNYQQYLDSIEAQADSMSSISIFAKPDTFNYRSIMKTPPAYSHMRDTVPVFDVSKGFTLATQNNFTDIFIGFIVLFAVISLMISDRESGMSGLLFSLRKGRGYLLATKLSALLLITFITILLMYSENLIIGNIIYGLGDFSRPVQSLNGFIGCNLEISVSAYTALYMLAKTGAFFAIGAVLSLIACNTGSTVGFYGISAIILTAEALAYALIHPLSVVSIFRYINLISLTRVNDIFCNFKNINFFGYPVPLIPTSVGAIAVIALICAVLSAITYSRKRNLEYKKLGIRLGFAGKNPLRSATFYAFYKSLVMQKGLLFVIAFAGIFAFMNVSFVKPYDPVDAYYQYYCTEKSGDITNDTLEFIEAETARFAEIQARLDELSQSGGFSSEANQLQRDLYPQGGFLIFSDRVSQIKELKGTEIFYDTGYNRIFGKAGYDDDMKYALTALLFCVFLVSPLIANDNKYRMSFLVSSSKSGKRSYIKRNIAIASIYGAVAWLMYTISYLVPVSRYYGADGLSASIRSITEFISFPVNMTVGQYLLLILISRLVFFIITALTMLAVSALCKSSQSATLINFAIFVLPVIVYLLGAGFMVNIGFNPLISVNALLNDFSIIQVIIPVAVISAVLTANIKKSRI